MIRATLIVTLALILALALPYAVFIPVHAVCRWCWEQVYSK